MSDQQEFTPEQIAEFQAYENFLADKAHEEASTAMYPAAGGAAGAALGTAIGGAQALKKVPEMLKGTAKDIGKSFATGASEAALTSGDKWAKAIGGPGGVNQDAAVKNRAMQRSLTPKEAAEFKVAREGIIVPNRVQAELAEEASKPMAKIMSGAKSLAPAASVLGKGLALGSAGYDIGDVVDRSNKGQYGRAAVSGLGALGSIASMVPHPLTKGVGVGASLAAPALNMYLDKLAKEHPELFEKLHLAEGGVVQSAPAFHYDRTKVYASRQEADRDRYAQANGYGNSAPHYDRTKVYASREEADRDRLAQSKAPPRYAKGGVVELLMGNKPKKAKGGKVNKKG